MSSIPPYDEKTTLARAAQGDESAFRLLFDRHRDRVYSFALWLTHQEPMAEEITQDVFTKVWLHREDLVHIDYFLSWLKTIARNQAYNYLKKSFREKTALRELAGNLAASGHYTEKTVETREYARILQLAVDRLPPQQQKVWLLSRQQGLKYEQIAKILGISIHTVKNHMKEALRSVRAYVDARIELLVLIALTVFFRD